MTQSVHNVRVGRGSKATKRPARGTIDVLPSGSLRVRVDCGIDPVTKRRYRPTEIVPAGPGAEKQANDILIRMLNEVNERWHCDESSNPRPRGGQFTRRRQERATFESKVNAARKTATREEKALREAARSAASNERAAARAKEERRAAAEAEAERYYAAPEPVEASGTGDLSGYTGPRCYAPGGKDLASMLTRPGRGALSDQVALCRQL